MAACIIRAIWSDAPPAPAATTISTGLVGSQAASAGVLAIMAVKTAAAFSICPTSFHPYVIVVFRKIIIATPRHCAGEPRTVQAALQCAAYDFRLRRKPLRQQTRSWTPI